MTHKHAQALIQTVQTLTEPGKGILALDESNATCTTRFQAVGVPSTPETRRLYRELLMTAPGSERHISGAILYDETLRQATSEGVPFPEFLSSRGQVPGIKVDTGAKDLANAPGEKGTEGLDGLRDRLAEYHGMGARFAKWRAVITIGDELPSQLCCEANAHAMARYAARCQEAGIVPIIEPEVLIDGAHDIDRCEAVTEHNLRIVFRELQLHRVLLEGAILKTSMVISGLRAATRAGVQEVAERTVHTLQRSVPAALGGVVFLSGGQGAVEATRHLNGMQQLAGNRTPWPMTFSYARALQQPALEIWGANQESVVEAQQAFAFRAHMNALASRGEYRDTMEKEVA
ncbi:MAG: fructose-bisphosphate aldolase class I [Ectothiorhodospiraceae bacterium]|nr:fructose-bisphosphate aldolase class I [Ectothiorhodospiraceae bacterium]